MPIGKFPHIAQLTLLFAVFGAVVVFAWRNQNPEIIFSLGTLCFGYYFGRSAREQNTAPLDEDNKKEDVI